MEGSKFPIIKDTEFFRFRGLVGLEHMKFKELQEETYLKTSDDKFVIVNQRTNAFHQIEITGSNPPEDALMVDKYGQEASPSHVPNAVIFIVGGATFEETRDVKELSKSLKKRSVILGGSKVLNSSSFLDDIAKLDLP